MEDENEQDASPIEVMPTGVPQSLAVLMLILVAVAAATSVYYGTHRPENTACVDGYNKAQIEMQKAQNEYMNLSVRRETELRLQVAKDCVTRGDIPVVIGGNVDCKQSPRR